ncbi:hypothetical protein Tco_0364135 [Tanacetum coccineum]
MSMTIQSSVKDKILATSSETSKVENAPAEMLRDLDQQMEKRADDGCTLWIKLYSKYEYEIRYHPGKANVVIEALSRKERVKPKCVRAMAMTIQYGVPLVGSEWSRPMTIKIEMDDLPRGFGRRYRKVLRTSACSLDEIEVDKILCFVEEPVKNSDYEVMRFLTSLLDDGRGSGSWMFLFVWSGYAAMRTLLWAGKVVSSSYIVESSWNSKSNFVLTLEIIRDDDEPQNESPNEGEGTTTKGLTVEYFDTFPTRDELTYHNMRRKLNPMEDVNGGISNFTGRIKGMHVFIGNFTYVVDFMTVEDISSIIDHRLSQVVLGRPFIEISNMTHDLPEGVVRFTNGDDEVSYKMAIR